MLVPREVQRRQWRVGEESAGWARNKYQGLCEMPRKGSSKGRKPTRKGVSEGRAYIQSTFNNTIVTITDLVGNVIAWGSSGTARFKGSRKGTPYAAGMSAQEAGRKAMNSGMRRLEVYIKGPGSGREAAVRSLQACGLTITRIRDVTPIPHDGCRPPRRRRV